MEQRLVELDDRYEDLSRELERNQETWSSIEHKFNLSWIYHDCALEGIVLTFHELKAAVEQNKASIELMPSYREIQNHYRAISRLRLDSKEAKDSRKTITPEYMKEIHATLGENIDHYTHGELRTENPLHRTYFHEIARPKDIEKNYLAISKWIETHEAQEMHPIEMACKFHHSFMRTFPFTQNSGKVGRLMLNFILMKNGYLPVIIHAVDRQRYYESLRQNDLQLLALVLDSMENGFENIAKYFREILSNLFVSLFNTGILFK